MGTWGTGIRQDDFVCDVEVAFKDSLKDGQSLSEATESVHKQFADALDDCDDGPLFWLALADMQWTYGDLDKSVLQRVDDIAESDIGMERWGEPSEKLYKQRKLAVARFHNKISQPNPKPSRPPKRISRKPKFTAGDCLSVQLENGQYGAALVLATDVSNPEQPADLVADLNYLSDEPPTIEIFVERDWLKLTHHRWQGRPNILWYHSVGFRKMKQRLTVVGNTSILATDPQQSSSWSGWNLLGQQILRQREWDAEKNA